MKKVFLLLSLAAFSTAAFAQEPMKTETKVRPNGTVKTESRTGRTEAGQAVHNTKEDAKYVGKKAGHAINRGAHKTGHAVKKGATAVKNKTEEVVH